MDSFFFPSYQMKILALVVALSMMTIISSAAARKTALHGKDDSFMVKAAFFDKISNTNSCATGFDFYNNDTAVESALEKYPDFANSGDLEADRREVAAFLAHFDYGTAGFCNIEEPDGASKNYCNKTATQYPCAKGKFYYGRGPLQLAWNYNYGPAGQHIGFDGLKNPDIVAKDVEISYETAFWYWMEKCHGIIQSGVGFGETIRALNGTLECDGADVSAVKTRVELYVSYCGQMEVDPGNNLAC